MMMDIKGFLSRLFKPKSTTSLDGLDGETSLEKSATSLGELDGETDEEISLEDEEHRCFEFYEMEEYH